jgi:FKBP-type peptidyl-prolyl cis-trans isomerase FklB
MNHRSPVLRALLTVLVLSFSACSKQPEKNTATAPAPAPVAPASAGPGIETVDQRVSYGIGYNVGAGLARDGFVVVDEAALKAGLADGLAKAKTRVPEADLQAAFTTLQQRANAAAEAEAGQQLAAGNDYLAKNQARAGVTVTASGLQYEVLASGTGPKPKPTDTVKVHYHGTLIDGTVFDSSVERNEPIEFAVTGVIQGWVEALQLMSVGDKWKLTIPSAIAYGPRAKGGIPANSVLVFEVELLGIK